MILLQSYKKRLIWKIYHTRTTSGLLRSYDFVYMTLSFLNIRFILISRTLKMLTWCMFRDNQPCQDVFEVHTKKSDFLREILPFIFLQAKSLFTNVSCSMKTYANSRLDFLPLSQVWFGFIVLYYDTISYMRTFSMVVTPRFTFWHITTNHHLWLCMCVYRS